MGLQELLDNYRNSSRSEREKGDYFERLVRVFLENDDIQKQYYSEVVLFADWAKSQGWSTTDIGIDLVATLADGSGYAAIQCKFYAPTYSIQKPDIDTFISAASNDLFTRLIIADTTRKEFGKNAKETLDKLSKDWNRIGIDEIESSRIDWSQFIRSGSISLAPKKQLRDHQRDALKAVSEGLSEADRGKMIMACGTGKTFTALRISETVAGKGKRVLFMVPSLALMSQTVHEWKNDCQEDFMAFSACSDKKVGRNTDPDRLDLNVHDLAFPATTDPERLALQVNHAPTEKMTVVFSTYHSIDVLTRAQKEYGLPEFDLVICDEAHRTTGVTLKDEDDSNFVRIHSNEYVSAKKRLYMTATPRIFGEPARQKADDNEAELASMDDETKFGKDLFHRGFGWAVEQDLLTDYKVVVLAVDEGLVSNTIQSRLKQGAELTLDDATKIIGCYKALTKSGIKVDLGFDPKPMRRALAFCQSIAKSRIVEEEFAKVVDEYTESDMIEDARYLSAEVRHIDGSYNASVRNEMLNWLKAETEEDTCRILTNAKVLSEGVDVPALDAIMFMHPRKSQIDVVQSVGRVMRKDPKGEKKLGYVILPVAIPPDVKPEEALNDNERYKVVWQILNALRAHDERLDARINQAELGEDIRDQMEIVRISSETELKELTTVVDDFATSKSRAEKEGLGIGKEGREDHFIDDQVAQGKFVFDEFTRAIMAKIVQKCGTREYWDTWARDIAKIAQTHITRITSIVGNEGPERTAFLAFLEELQDDLNPEINESEAVEMLAQHLITKPVFDALFKESQFTKANPVSRAMEVVLGQLHEHNLAKESESLSKFYASVERRAEGVVTAHGRQELIYKLYDSFFKGAFPVLTQRLGIVYTPVEVVDFILHSVNDVLKSQFGQTLGSEGVHILDPFTGTGTFITRLLQSGLIAPAELARKYREEIHANEIVLLAYYIAAINIETVYHELIAGKLEDDTPYEPFRGILLTDTFQMYEQDRDMVANLLPDNSERRSRQKELDIRVIIGNPPYSAGQGSANDNAANIAYPTLDDAIRNSYAAHTTATNKNALYDSYIRAFRWASERLGEAGVMAFVSGSAWIERSFASGMRKCLAEEFSDLYVFHLRGDIRKNMLSKGAAREGQNIFSSGSMTGISIAVLIKNPNASESGQIHFHDIGPDLTTTQKLNIIRSFGSVDGITKSNGWIRVIPDRNNDWLDQVDPSFDRFIHIGDKALPKAEKIFEIRSRGLETSRDSWAYNASRTKLYENIQRSIDHYNMLLSENREPEVDTRKISWTRGLRKRFKNREIINIEDGQIVSAIYRPFEKTNAFVGRTFNEYVNQIPRIFPNSDAKNLVIQISGKGARSGFSALMSNTIPDIQNVDNGQCFPLYLYEESKSDDGLFASTGDQGAGITRRDAITDGGLAHFKAAYPGNSISKEDLFYYVYGLLHSPDYRERFKNNLTKSMPRIPAVRTFKEFAAFRDAGRALGNLHVNFESVEPYMVTFKEGDHRLINEAQDNPKEYYRVKKMKFGGKGKEKDKTTVVYNENITIQNIPVEAFEYVVNGKPALVWVMERQAVKTDKNSRIVNDANDYANETIGDPKYPLELFQRMITVSLETIKIVRELPPLDIDTKNSQEFLSVPGKRAAIAENWNDSPAATIAIKIVDAVSKSAVEEKKSWRVGEILEMLGKKELTQDVVAALSILVQSEYAIFHVSADFVDSDNMWHRLSAEEFQRVIDEDTLLHPVTQVRIESASKSVVPLFELEKDLFGGSVH